MSSPPRTPPKCNSFLSIRDKWNKRDTTTTSAPPEPEAAFPFSPQKSRKKKKKSLPPIGAPGLNDANENKSPVGRSKSFGQAYSSNSPIRRAKSFGEVQSVGSSIPKPPAFDRCVSLPCNSKSVRFSEKHQIRDIETIDELSESLILSLWWSEGDYIEMRQGWETVLYLLESGKPVCEDTLSSRGLQKRTDSGAWELYECQRDARNAVFEVQERQRKSKRTDPYEISLAYLQHTAKSQVEALEQGAVDAKSVDKFKRKKSKKYSSQSPKKSSSSTKKSPKPKSSSKKKSAPRPCVLQDSFVLKDPLSPAASPKSKRNVAVSVKPSRKVQFNDELTFFKAKKVKDMVKAIKRRWISEKELQGIAKGFKSTVKLIERGTEVEETDEQSARGLEQSTKEGQKKLAERRQKVLETVLKAQEKGESSDAETLAEAYRGVTAEDARRAIKQGKHDARDAKQNRVRRRSIQGCLGHKLNAESKDNAIGATPSISTEESSVEPEFVRLAKKRRARRASISETRSFRQKNKTVDITPDSMIADSIARMKSTNNATKTEQSQARERTPTPPQDRWCRMKHSSSVGTPKSPKVQRTPVVSDQPGGGVKVLSIAPPKDKEESSPNAKTPTVQENPVAPEKTVAVVKDLLTVPQTEKIKEDSSPSVKTPPRLVAVVDHSQITVSDSKTKVSGSCTCPDAARLICSKEDEQLPNASVSVPAPALTTTSTDNALGGSSASFDGEKTIPPPPIATLTAELEEKDCGTCTTVLVAPISVIECTDLQSSLEEHRALGACKETKSPSDDQPILSGDILSEMAVDLGIETQRDLEKRDDRGAPDATERDTTVADLSLIPEAQVDVTIDDSDAESVCTRTSVTALASKFNITRTISSDSRVSSCSARSSHRTPGAPVRNTSGTSSIGSYLETISRAISSVDSKSEVPPIPKRVFRLPPATFGFPAPRPTTSNCSLTQEPVPCTSGLSSSKECSTSSPLMKEEHPAANENSSGAGFSCQVKTKPLASARGVMVEDQNALQDLDNSTVEQQASSFPPVSDGAANIWEPAGVEMGISKEDNSEMISVIEQTPVASIGSGMVKEKDSVQRNEHPRSVSSIPNGFPVEEVDYSGPGKGNLGQDSAVNGPSAYVQEAVVSEENTPHDSAPQTPNPSLVEPLPIAVEAEPRSLETSQDVQFAPRPLQDESGSSFDNDRTGCVPTPSTVPGTQMLGSAEGIKSVTSLDQEVLEEHCILNHIQPVPTVASLELQSLDTPKCTATATHDEPGESRQHLELQSTVEMATHSQKPEQDTVWLQVRQSDLVPIHSEDGRIMYLVLVCQQRLESDQPEAIKD